MSAIVALAEFLEFLKMIVIIFASRTFLLEVSSLLAD